MKPKDLWTYFQINGTIGFQTFVYHFEVPKRSDFKFLPGFNSEHFHGLTDNLDQNFDSRFFLTQNIWKGCENIFLFVAEILIFCMYLPWYLSKSF